MADREETDGQRRAREAGEKAQSDAESGASGDLTAVEEYIGSGEDGDACTLTDGREGVVRSTATGMKCVVEKGGAAEE